MSEESLQDVRDIRRLMEQSSRFSSISGLGGIAAGLIGLAGAALARYVIFPDYNAEYDQRGSFDGQDFSVLKLQLFVLAMAVFAAAFFAALYLTWRKAVRQGVGLWSATSRRVMRNMAIPLLAGGFFVLGMLHYNEWRFVAPACLIFYGLALINASKYTIMDIRYLGYGEIILGLVSMYWINQGLLFWALGFGVMHLIYGVALWWKEDREPSGKL